MSAENRIQSLGDMIEQHLEKLGIITLVGTKDLELRTTEKLLKDETKQKEFLQIHLSTAIDERNKLREEVEMLRKEVNRKEEIITETRQKLQQSDDKLRLLESVLMSKDAVMEALKGEVGPKIREFIANVIGSAKKGDSEEGNKVGKKTRPYA